MIRSRVSPSRSFSGHADYTTFRRHAHRNFRGLELLEQRRLLNGASTESPVGCGCGVCAAAAKALNDATQEQPGEVIVNQVARPTAVADRMWQPLTALPAARNGQMSHLPLNAYAPFTIDHAALTTTLASAPMEFTAAARSNPLLLSMPNPDGIFQRFNVVETQVLAPELSARFPEIKTFVARGIDDPTAVARLDINPHTGFHAMVLSETGTWAIDNYFHNENTAFVSYRKSDINRVSDFKCLTVSTPNDASETGLQGGPENIPAGTVLRTFRLAITTTTSYNSAHGNTISTVLSAVTTTVNRMTGIYEVNLSTRLQLVANTTLLFSGLDGNPVISGGTNVSTLANNNQSFTDGRIGFANYDVGHVFSSGANNGVSAGGIGIVGSSAKARACSQTSPPSGDLFSVDYVSHEVGHQFNARHNFSNCSGPGDSGAIANEPGSGATIMGYAGLCGSNNLQPNSDAMFNHINYNQAYPYVINTIPGVGTTTATGNNPPTVSAGPNYIIPARTPYELHAVGSDPDNDPLVYSWEGRDTGGSFPVNNTSNTTGPIVRTWLPTSNPVRTIPRLQNLLANNTATGEVLTTVSRNINFRVVVRDNLGGVNFSDKTVSTINVGATGFMVTNPNTTGITWQGGSSQTIQWNVASTNLAPINTSNVNIRMSLDGGFTYPVMLAENTPNDGSELIQLPFNIGSTGARIRVEAVDNIYFDISNFNLTLVNVPSGTIPQQPILASTTDSGVFNNDGVTNFDNSSPAKALILDVPGTVPGATVTVYADGVAIGSAVATGSTTTVTTNGTTTLANGARNITARQTEAGNPESLDSVALQVTIDTIAPQLVGLPAFNFLAAPHSLAYTFSENVGPTLAASNFVVERQDATPVNTTVSGYDTGTHVASIQFPGAVNFVSGILPDGRYTATLVNTGITDLAGNALQTNNAFDFFFLMGDANRDGRVDLDDFNIVAGNFGQSPRDFTQGDFTYNGVVNLDDFNIFAAQFGKELAPAARAAGAAPLPGTSREPTSSPFGTARIGGGQLADDEPSDEWRLTELLA